jgi:HAD superfamily hydrolase (TIGR01457 family)
MKDFNDIHALIIDMDGVLWHGNQALPGLIDFFSALRTKNIRFVLATNNARQTIDQYVQKLFLMGVTVTRDQILTSATATACYLANHFHPPSTRVFIIGEEGLKHPILEQGFILIEPHNFISSDTPPSLPKADIVVCGLDKTITWEKLSTAALHIRAGAKFFATNADPTLPTEFGQAIGNGSVLAALSTATGVTATIIGKPEPTMYEQAMSLLQSAPENTVAIGDKLETDILGAVRTNIRSLLVLTGISGLEDIEKSDYKPTWILPDIRAVTQALMID